MQRFIYVSTATSSMGAGRLSEIRFSCEQRNQSDALTGVLLYADGSFLQILEGPEDPLEAAIGRITKDTRHRGMTKMLNLPITERIFSDWVLACFSERDKDLSDFVQMPTPTSVFSNARSTPSAEVEVFVRTFYDCVNGRAGVRF